MASAIEAMRENDWRQLVEPTHIVKHGLRKDPPELAYMLDNGAWGCHARGVEWDSDGFLELLDLLGEGSDMTVLPDIVGGGEASLERSLEWADRVKAYGAPVLLAVQDGMTAEQVVPVLEELGAGIFVGGSTTWKIETMPLWGRVSRDLGCWLHIARVNSMRRIRACHTVGADSFDGTSVTKYPVTVDRLSRGRDQLGLLLL